MTELTWFNPWSCIIDFKDQDHSVRRTCSFSVSFKWKWAEAPAVQSSDTLGFWVDEGASHHDSTFRGKFNTVSYQVREYLHNTGGITDHILGNIICSHQHIFPVQNHCLSIMPSKHHKYFHSDIESSWCPIDDIFSWRHGPSANELVLILIHSCQYEEKHDDSPLHKVWSNSKGIRSMEIHLFQDNIVPARSRDIKRFLLSHCTEKTSMRAVSSASKLNSAFSRTSLPDSTWTQNNFHKKQPQTLQVILGDSYMYQDPWLNSLPVDEKKQIKILSPI